MQHASDLYWEKLTCDDNNFVFDSPATGQLDSNLRYISSNSRSNRVWSNLPDSREILKCSRIRDSLDELLAQCLETLLCGCHCSVYVLLYMRHSTRDTGYYISAVQYSRIQCLVRKTTILLDGYTNK